MKKELGLHYRNEMIEQTKKCMDISDFDILLVDINSFTFGKKQGFYLRLFLLFHSFDNLDLGTTDPGYEVLRT